MREDRQPQDQLPRHMWRRGRIKAILTKGEGTMLANSLLTEESKRDKDWSVEVAAMVGFAAGVLMTTLAFGFLI